MDLDDLVKKMLSSSLGGGLGKKKKKKKGFGFEGELSRMVLTGVGIAGAAAVIKGMEGNRPAASSSPSTPQQPLPPPSRSNVAQGGSIPPPPGATPSASPSSPGDARALLILRAMVTAANADHRIDDEERRRILAKVETLGIDDQQRRLLHQEFDRPTPLHALAREVGNDATLSRQVYLASLLAIDPDTEAEKYYLQQLAEALGIPPSEVRELEEKADF